ncbi:MAG TPA: LamG domain-containing protein, partial [Candidatus Pacearchaeota archaeon]|nr:LamG domain-containing protein [Candidatus Pacearchaeota archaeon]
MTDPEADAMTVYVYANNDSGGLNNSDGLVYIEENVANGSEVTYNLTALPVKPSEDGLVALWHFDNLSVFGENDTYFYNFAGSGGINNASCSVSTCPDFNISEGKFGGSFNFDNSSNDEIILDSGFTSYVNFSIMAWIKLDVGVIPGINYALWGKDSMNRIMIRTTDHYIELNDNPSQGSSTTSMVGFWEHIAIIKNDSTGNFYRNGVLIDSWFVGTTAIDFSSSSIGSRPPGVNFFRGNIDEFAIYNISLNASEVLDKYRLGEGTYYWQVNVSDGALSNISNMVEFTVDATAPTSLNFTSPALDNASITTNNWIFVNVTSSESINTCLLDWNNGSTQNVSMSTSGTNCFVNMTNLIDYVYTFKVWANDSAGNLNSTELRQITINTVNSYHIDSTNGDDSNNGFTDSAPFQTISKLNDILLSPGDIIYFKRGELWREQLNISSSGNSSDFITFTTYGAGDKPIISGSDLVTGWTLYSGNTYNTSLATFPGQIYVNNTIQLPNGTSSDALTVGRYFYNATENMLYIHLPNNGNVSQSTIEATRDHALLIDTASYLNFSDLRLEKTNKSTIYITTLSSSIDNFIFKNINSSYAGERGFEARGSSRINNVTIENSIISYWAREFVDLNVSSYFSSPAITLRGNTGGDYWLIRNNTIIGDGVYGFDTSYDINGIDIKNSVNPIIEYNEIKGAHHGIVIRGAGSSGWNIRYNYVHELADDLIWFSNVDSSTGVTYGNILANGSDDGVDTDGSLDVGLIANNIFYEVMSQMIPYATEGAHGIFKNNIFVKVSQSGAF